MVRENLVLLSILNCRQIKPNLTRKSGKEEEGRLFCFHGIFRFATLCGTEVISDFGTPASMVLFAFLRKGKCLESWKPFSTQILFLNNISGRVCLKYSSNVKSCTWTEFNSISYILFESKGTGIKGKKRSDPQILFKNFHNKVYSRMCGFLNNGRTRTGWTMPVTEILATWLHLFSRSPSPKKWTPVTATLQRRGSSSAFWATASAWFLWILI